MEIKDLLRGVIKEMVEARIRETDITDGSRVAFGSPEHVTDLEMRIADLERWRDRQRRGSEARANYARLISRLRAELRSASRISNPQAPVDELAEASRWIVKHKDDGYTLYGPQRSEEEARAIADVRNSVAMKGAHGKRPGAEPPYVVEPYEDNDPFMQEGVEMDDPEFDSIETFVQHLLDDERETYTHEELTALNFRTHMPINAIRKELEGYGLTLANRPNVKRTRGFSTSSNDRWFGPGSAATHGGAGIDPQTGRATSGRGDI